MGTLFPLHDALVAGPGHSVQGPGPEPAGLPRGSRGWAAFIHTQATSAGERSGKVHAQVHLAEENANTWQWRKTYPCHRLNILVTPAGRVGSRQPLGPRCPGQSSAHPRERRPASPHPLAVAPLPRTPTVPGRFLLVHQAKVREHLPRAACPSR